MLINAYKSIISKENHIRFRNGWICVFGRYRGLFFFQLLWIINNWYGRKHHIWWFIWRRLTVREITDFSMNKTLRFSSSLFFLLLSKWIIYLVSKFSKIIVMNVKICFELHFLVNFIDFGRSYIERLKLFLQNFIGFRRIKIFILNLMIHPLMSLSYEILTIQ